MVEASALPLWAEMVRALTPAGAFIVASAAAFIAWRSHVRQKEADERQKLADRRAEFWRRMVWAIEQVADRNIFTANMGMTVLTSLAESDLARDEDMELLLGISELAIERVTQQDYDETDPG